MYANRRQPSRRCQQKWHTLHEESASHPWIMTSNPPNYNEEAKSTIFAWPNTSNGEHGRMSPRMVSHGLNVSLHHKPPRTQHLPRGGCIIFIFDSTAQHELFLLSFFSSKKSVLRDYAAAPFGCLECLKSNFWMYCGL